MIAVVATIVKPTNADADAAHTRGMRAELLESMANTSISIIKDEISSRIKAAFLDDVVSFTQSSSSPTHDSMDGCVQAKDNISSLASISAMPKTTEMDKFVYALALFISTMKSN